ncbi:MAG TPA: PH domain-containing protein [Gemmatimonadaceae bacterium]|nr:PH domain-containing protein [Gemmatimonadaceae bacterium]
MSYVDSQLLEGETVRYRGRRNKVLFTGPYLTVGLAIVSAVVAVRSAPAARHTWWWITLIIAVVAAIWLLACRVRYASSEFAVTNKRLVIKTGWIQRRTLETMLSKVEGVGVDQGVMGRMLNYGTITVTGTGGTKEIFEQIAAPLEFRRQVQGAISAAEDARR